MVDPFKLFAYLPRALGIQFPTTRLGGQRTQLRPAARNIDRLQDLLVGEVRNPQLVSDEPGALRLAWDAADPAPTDYCVNWTTSTGDFPSYRESNGNAYPQTNEFLITGLAPGVEYLVRVRSRYLDENGRELRHGPWTQIARQVVAAEADRGSGPDFLEGLSHNVGAEPEMVDVTQRAKVRTPAYRVLPGRATPHPIANSNGNGRYNSEYTEESEILAVPV